MIGPMGKQLCPETIFRPWALEDFLAPKSTEHILASLKTFVWSFMMVGVKEKHLCTGNILPSFAFTGGSTWRFQFTPHPLFFAGVIKNKVSKKVTGNLKTLLETLFMPNIDSWRFISLWPVPLTKYVFSVFHYSSVDEDSFKDTFITGTFLKWKNYV